jgi:DNA (cytosine-5)-methyltransferase 1
MFSKKVTFIDLFAGIGGFRIALNEFGANCVFSSEFDKYAQQTYEANFGEKPSGDIRKIEANEIPAHDILCAGFPCQAFSVSGKQRGFEDSRGTLFFEIARIVDYHKPKIIFLENVANLKKHSDGQTISSMISILEDMGYNVFHEVLNASDFGVPQSRNRIYFLAFRNDLGVEQFKFPKGDKIMVALEDILLPDEKTVDFIIDREDMKIKDIEITEKQLKPIRIGTINKGGQGDRIYSPKGHAITLSAYGGGSGAKTGAYLINGKVRKLAPEECRAVQGFPDWYKIVVSNSQAWKQFGNSVAVPVLRSIISKVIEIPNLIGDLTENIETTDEVEAC